MMSKTKRPFAEPTYAVMPLYYGGGEIHCCGLDNYRHYELAFLKRLAEIEQYIAKKNGMLRVWCNVADSHLTKQLMVELISALKRVQPHIFKISMIGLGLRKHRFNRMLKKEFGSSPLAIAYYEDAELAKKWLV